MPSVSGGLDQNALLGVLGVGTRTSVSGGIPQTQAPGQQSTSAGGIALLAANATALTITENFTSTFAGDGVLLNGTWNTTGIVYGLRLSITNTASNASSRLLDLTVGGTSQFNVTPVGIVNAANSFRISTTVLSTSNLVFSGDAILQREAANVLSVRNGVTPQTWRVYGTYTDTTTHDYCQITKTAGGSATISTVKGSVGGTEGDLVLRGGATGGQLTLNSLDTGATFTGTVNSPTSRNTTEFTVATLPAAAAGNKGMSTFVTDGLGPVFGAAVVGGGAVFTSVYSNGTTWLCG